MIALLVALAASPLMDRAAAADAALSGSDRAKRLRHRHVRVLKLWQTVVRRGPANEHCPARAKEVEAWARLAHWSGSAADAGRAEAERRAYEEACLAAAEEPVPEKATLAAVSLEASREPRSARASGPPPGPPPGAPTIVLDPGHGGTERGARGPGGRWEKDYNLDVALRLEARLARRFHVLMTRRKDETVGLDERVHIANRSDAVLFVSIHGNAHHEQRFHGIETYVLDAAGRRFARRLEDREAQLHLPEFPTDTPERLRDVELLLARMAMQSATQRSEDLANAVHGELIDALRSQMGAVRDLGLRRALFHVLLGARMPAVLVESGFLSHPVEGRHMMQDTWREAVAEGLARGITRYVEGYAGHGEGGWLAHLGSEGSASMTHSISASRGKSESAK